MKDGVDSDEFQGVYSADKYQSKNPIARSLVQNFMSTVLSLAGKTGVKDLHEVGCGEGQLCGLFARDGFRVRGSDISDSSLAVAHAEAMRLGLKITFLKTSIYELDPQEDAAELVVCCEVLEHLKEPDRALHLLSQLAKPYIILSVPREPLWRVLNMMRGKYLGGFGNTPDHIQHWSTYQFVKFAEQYVDVMEVRKPIPWTVLLCRSKTGASTLIAS